MSLRTIQTFVILFISLSTWGQTTIRGTTNISSDGIISDSVNNSPNKKFEKRINIRSIDKSDSELEIRFYELTSLSNTNNLKIIKLRDKEWTSIEYDEWNSPVKIKKYKLNAMTDFDSFAIKLLDQNLTRLPDQDDLKDKMKKYTERNGRRAEQKISVLDGHRYTVEFKLGDKFRIYQFDNPDSYARFYNNVPELKNYVAIKDLFQKELTRK
jgi:hypothetical protein